MAMTDDMTISRLETYMVGLLKGVVSDNVFAATLPDVPKSTMTDMVLVDCNGDIADRDAYCEGYILVWLYVKPVNGIKNVKRMGEMEDALNRIVIAANDKKYVISRSRTYSDYDDRRKWHCNIVELRVKIY